MKVSGFTFIRNAIINDYPIVQAIQSVLPLCDEFVVAVGKSDDETLDLIKNIHFDTNFFSFLVFLQVFQNVIVKNLYIYPLE